MKFVGIVSTVIYFNQVHASMESIERGHKEFLKKMGGNNRNLMKESLKTLNQYGCWCFFDDNIIGNGKGLPRDFIDEECRSLHRAYTCAAAEIQGCIPWKAGDMNHGSQSFGEPGVGTDILRACEYGHRFLPQILNGVEYQACAVAACAAETKFIQNVNAYLLTEDADYDSFTQIGAAKATGGIGTFNHERECVAECPKGVCYSDKDDRQCCGKFPERFPFKVHAGDANQQACCGGNWINFNNAMNYGLSGEEVYTTATHNCVNNKVVAK